MELSTLIAQLDTTVVGRLKADIQRSLVYGYLLVGPIRIVDNISCYCSRVDTMQRRWFQMKITYIKDYGCTEMVVNVASMVVVVMFSRRDVVRG